MALIIHIGLEWGIGGSIINLAAITQFLGGIAETGTVRATADKLGISYRTVWRKLEEAEASLGQRLIVKSKGHGSKLTSDGAKLKSLVDDFSRRLQANSQQEIEAFEKKFRGIFVPEPRKLRMACSHDLVLEDCMQSGLISSWQIRYMSSQKAIVALRAGKVDLAGFHLPEKIAGQRDMKELWADPHYFVAPIMCRELGLIVARGNPLKIRGIEDLARPEIRFMNRQKNSGTRLRLEEILRAKGIDQKAINGYQQEEFTHSAVAHAVAAGAADMAFALRAVTVDLDVVFIPVGLETYCVCGRTELAVDSRYRNMLKVITDRMTMHPGYAKSFPVPKTTRHSKASRLAAIAQWVENR